MSAEDRVATEKARFAVWSKAAKETGEEPALPAATVIVLRDGADGPETLMLRKNSKIAFGGMWVFPGGKVDAEDWDGADDDVAAAANAAVREAAEEDHHAELGLVIGAPVGEAELHPLARADERAVGFEEQSLVFHLARRSAK